MPNKGFVSVNDLVVWAASQPELSIQHSLTQTTNGSDCKDAQSLRNNTIIEYLDNRHADLTPTKPR